MGGSVVTTIKNCMLIRTVEEGINAFGEKDLNCLDNMHEVHSPFLPGWALMKTLFWDQCTFQLGWIMQGLVYVFRDEFLEASVMCPPLIHLLPSIKVAFLKGERWSGLIDFSFNCESLVILN